jgi:hypothetical protein
MKGSAGIEQLQLEVLNKVISKMPTPPGMFFSGMFGTDQNDSDTIKWDIEYGSAGMTPFVAPGAVAPSVGLDGIGAGSASAAYYKEKMFMDEKFLNNLREPGTFQTLARAEKKLAKGLMKLKNRCMRRREWMCAQMLVSGGFSYLMEGGIQFSLSYGVPSAHLITLAADRKWGIGVNRNPLEDIMDARTMMSDDASVQVKYGIMNSQLLQDLVLDEKIQALLSKSAFGDGQLFSNSVMVLKSLFNIPNLVIYDEFFEVTGWVTTDVSSTTIYLDDVSDFEVGGTARFYNMTKPDNVWEDRAITAVDKSAGTITIASAVTGTYKGNRDKVTMRKKFIPDNVFILMNDTNADGQKIAEFMEAPYGNDRRWGMYTDRHDEWDPEGVWVRVQDKGLPVLYHPDTIITMTVK